MMMVYWQSLMKIRKWLGIGIGWDRNSLSQADTVSGVPHLIDKDMVRESISNMKNGKTAGPPDVCQKG